MAHDGVLTPWDGRPLEGPLATVGNLWCRTQTDAAWELDVLVGDGDADEWVYRRDAAVRRPWDEAVLHTPERVPYLAPELQLLFKSVSARPKDDHDALVVIPALAPDRRSFLADQLVAEHRWQTVVAGHRAQLALDDDQAAPMELLASGRSSQAWYVDAAERRCVVRVPIPNSGRLMSYRSEAQIGDLLADAGHPISRWSVRTRDDCDCSVGTLLEGTPIAYDSEWTASFALALALALRDLHHLPATGWGPLENASTQLVGTSMSERQGIVDRWFHAAMWPFDGSSFLSHPIVDVEPELAMQVAQQELQILGAVGAPFGVLHSDLHQQHLLHIDGELSGVLDFGDAFIGSIAWDFALLLWYYGPRNAERFAHAYGSGPEMLERGTLLALAVGCYKIAKTPQDKAARHRLHALLDAEATKAEAPSVATPSAGRRRVLDEPPQD